MKVFLLLFGFVFSVHGASLEPSRFDFSEYEQIPVQSGGRLKPLSSFSQEIALHLAGQKKVQGFSASEWLLSLMVHSEYWKQQKILSIPNNELKRKLLLDEKQTKFSFQELVDNSVLFQYSDQSDESTAELWGKINLFHSVLSRTVFKMIPVSGGWQALSSYSESQILSMSGREIRKIFGDLLVAYQMKDESLFRNLSQDLRKKIESEMASVVIQGQKNLTQNRLNAEFYYIRYQPFFWASILYFFASLCFFVSTRRATQWLGITSLSLAILIHTIGFAIRSYIAGRPPVSNMYESVVWVSWGAVVFALIFYAFKRQIVLLKVGTIVGGLALWVSMASPAVMDPSIHHLVPVLRSNFWLTVHVLTITLGYSAFALSWGLGNGVLICFLRRIESTHSTVQRLNQLVYLGIQVGVVLLAAGTILGGIWADYSWGRFWGWDPKEVWALIALLTYLAVLHARFVGWVNAFSFPVWAVLGFSSVVMAWYGVNFVLGVGLHSYGFSSGGQSTVAVALLIQIGFVSYVSMKRRKMDHEKTSA